MTGARYSVILPTYNERENLPLIIMLLVETFEKKCVRLGESDLAVAAPPAGSRPAPVPIDGVPFPGVEYRAGGR